MCVGGALLAREPVNGRERRVEGDRNVVEVLGVRERAAADRAEPDVTTVRLPGGSVFRVPLHLQPMGGLLAPGKQLPCRFAARQPLNSRGESICAIAGSAPGATRQ